MLASKLPFAVRIAVMFAPRVAQSKRKAVAGSNGTADRPRLNHRGDQGKVSIFAPNLRPSSAPLTRSALAINALAFTCKSDIVFAEGRCEPNNANEEMI
jgi:hypothetical protein